MDKYNIAGQSLVGLYGEIPKALQCDVDGNLIVSITERKMRVLQVIAIDPSPTSTYNPPAGAIKLVVNALPTNTANVKYGTSADGRRLMLKAGDTIQIPATTLSFESVTGTQNLGIIAYGY